MAGCRIGRVVAANDAGVGGAVAAPR